MNSQVVSDFLRIPLLEPVVAVIETANWFAMGFAALLAFLLLRGYRQLRGTTLRAPCLWALVVTAGLAFWAIIEMRSGPVAAQSNHFVLRFLMSTLTFCPLMGVLGAKRPQDRGWQWVVLSLWVILIWPAVQATLLPQGSRLDLFIAWKLFLAGLIGLGLMNYLPTRHALAAMLVAAGQLVLLDEFMGNFELVSPAWTLPVGMSCFVLAAILVSRTSPNCASLTKLESLTVQWRNYRDAFGAFWTIRILGQINQNAELRQWPMRLGWSGFEVDGEQPTEEQLGELERQMVSLLRRFV